MLGKNYLKIRLTTQQLSFLISNILCKIVVNDVLNNQNIKMLEFFESLNDTRDFLFWNSKQGTGEWLLLRKLFGTFFTSKWLSPEWVLGRFWECLIQKMTWNILYKGGEGEFFLKMASPQKRLLPKNGFSPENGFSPKMASPAGLGNSKYITF